MRKKRADIAIEETWDLTDLFTTNDDFKKALTQINEDVKKVVQYKGQLTKSAQHLFDALSAYESFQEQVIRVATYANLKVNADGSDPNNQAKAAKVAATMAKINAQLSFIESELLATSKEDIDQYLQEEPKLETYRVMLEDILAKKAYSLSPETEEILAALSEVHEAPYMIYQRSKSSDMEFDPITDEAGNELPMSFALYEDRYELEPNTHIQHKAFDSLLKTLNQYKHTYAAVYATEVTKQVTLARARGYDSVTDMLLHPQKVTQEMYYNQLDIIQQELAPHMRKYAKLKQKQLGLDEMRFCDLQVALDPEFVPETTYEEASKTIMEALQIMGPEYSEIIKKALTERWVDR